MKSGRNWGRLGMTFNIKQVQLKDLLLEPIRNGLTKPRAIRGRGVPMIAMGEIFANNRIFSFPMERVPVTDKELSSSSIYEGDLLFARQSLVLEGAGKCCIVKEVNEPTVFESHLIRVRLDNSKVLPDYIYYYFNSYQGKENIKTIVEQVAAAGIRGRDLVNLYIPIPPITVQQQILQVLMSIDDKIAINTTINENLESQAQAIFKAWFVDFEPFGGVMPEDWRIGSLSEICGYSKDKVNIEDLTLDTYYSTENMQPNRQGAVQATTLPTIKQTTACKKGDVLISNIRPYFKKIIYCFADCGCSTDVLCFVPNKSEYSAFLYCALYSNKFFDYMVAGSKGTKMPRGDKQQIMMYPICIPSTEYVEQFSKIVAPMLETVYTNRLEANDLAILRDTLLPKLMNGEIDVSKVKI